MLGDKQRPELWKDPHPDASSVLFYRWTQPHDHLHENHVHVPLLVRPVFRRPVPPVSCRRIRPVLENTRRDKKAEERRVPYLEEKGMSADSSHTWRRTQGHKVWREFVITSRSPGYKSYVTLRGERMNGRAEKRPKQRITHHDRPRMFRSVLSTTRHYGISKYSR